MPQIYGYDQILKYQHPTVVEVKQEIQGHPTGQSDARGTSQS